MQPVTIHVLGDVMLDRYLLGRSDRMSPEAPVPVVRVLQRKEQPGGAGNVAANVVGMGARCVLFGLLGQDAEAKTLSTLLHDLGVDFRPLVCSDRPTTHKTRIVASAQQLLRLDEEQTQPLPNPQDLIQLLSGADFSGVWIVSDYAKGSCHPQVLEYVYARCRGAGGRCLTDPKSSDWTAYSGSHWISPNWKELCAYLGKELPMNEDGIAHALAEAAQKSGISDLLVTLSELGMAYWHEGQVQRIPTQAREVFDVSGAGDTVIAVLAVGLAQGLAVETALRRANRAAGIVVGKKGTVAIQREWLEEMA
jgi:D-beta-D-heptose 7-phosphate kinase/D-beta-D-heptose 1-phosphate adenosyltransferase